jgi:hypothetical protein
MNRCASVVALLLAAVAGALPAAATTYVPVSDDALVDHAAVIGVFEVVSSDLAPTERLITQYHVRAESLLKGDLGGSTIVVRVPGGESDSLGVRFSGMPRFRIGERALLFLVRRSDETWGIAHLLLGAFHELEGPGGGLLVRPHLREAQRLDRRGRSAGGDGPVARERERFLAWIADRAAGRRRAADYLVPLDVASLAPRFSLSQDDADGHRIRWFAFDTGGSVIWRSADTGQPGFPDDGVAALRAGIAAWDRLSGTMIRLVYGGKGPVDNGLQKEPELDGANTVLFEDPHGQIDDEFNCLQGGVLAIGGPIYFTSTRLFKGKLYHPIAEGSVITNKNTSCFFLGNTVRLSEVLGHELGHTLGLAHSCDDDGVPACSSSPALEDSLMGAFVHDDGRGARLGADDIAAVRSLYPSSINLPRAPINLTASFQVNDVTLSWGDRSNNEQGFRVFRRLGAGQFEEVGQTAAGVASFVDLDLESGTWSYEVRAFNESGDSGPSNRVTVVIEDATPGAVQLADTVFYGSEDEGVANIALQRTGGKTGTLSVRVRTRDLSALAGADYAARDLTISWASNDGLPKFVAVSLFDDFTTEDGELIEVLLETVPAAGQAEGLPLGSAVIAVADNDGSPGCASSDRRLCLLGGRFEVEVEWRQNDGNRGVGNAVIGSDQSGYFWFFSSLNVELIVKALDGRSLNGAHWLFYGALSDVEYWITVTDTATGERKLYRNAPGNICGVGDTQAFPQGAAASAALARAEQPLSRPTWLLPAAPISSTPRAGCVADDQTLCLLGGRFRVRVPQWRNHRNGRTGVGHAIPYSDQTGLFWFDNPASIELAAKSLDGRTNNGKYWFFYGALSDIEYSVTVTDTVTGATHSYNNAAGNICGVGDTSAFPGD